MADYSRLLIVVARPIDCMTNEGRTNQVIMVTKQRIIGVGGSGGCLVMSSSKNIMKLM